MCDLTLGDFFVHISVWVCLLAINAALRRETAMSLDDHVAWHTSLTLEAVDVLSEMLQQHALVVEQLDKRMRDGRAIATRVQFMRQGVEWLGVFPEKSNVKDSFGLGQV